MLFRAALAGLLTLGVLTRSVPAYADPPPTPPRLIVFLVVDQMRADYVDRFHHQWKYGLKRLLDRGAWFRQAAYPYLDTVTCPGHATLGTGAFPSAHGMVLNAWWDPITGKSVPCTNDPNARLVGHGGKAEGGDSAANLMLPTFADELRQQLTPLPRVVSLSMKARAAISLAGHRGDAVLWFANGVWATSTAYATMPLPWVEAYVRTHPVSARLTKPWTRLLPEPSYLFADDAAEESPPPGWGRTFPHAPAIPGKPDDSTLWENTPDADLYLGELAQAAQSELGLGTRDSVDYLAVSFSALDRVGHAFGPRSHEVQDVLARLDVTLGELFDALDKRVGPSHYVVALSADHGVAPYPEQISAAGFDAGRIPLKELTDAVNAALTAALGPGQHLSSVQYTDIYLAPGAAAQLAAKPGAMTSVLERVRRVPGVAAAFAGASLVDREGGGDPLRKAAATSYFPGRSGDILVVPKPHWLTVPAGTTHGSFNGYDTRVPILLMGPGIARGSYMRAVSPADIVATFATLVGITLPRAEGLPLSEALHR